MFPLNEILQNTWKQHPERVLFVMEKVQIKCEGKKIVQFKTEGDILAYTISNNE